MDIEKVARILAEDSVLAEQRIFVGEASFFLNGIGIEITAKICRSVFLPSEIGDRYDFSLSHYVHTPTQAGPYAPSAPYASDAESAMKRAISSLTNYYNEAVQAGHRPHDNWLVRVPS